MTVILSYIVQMEIFRNKMNGEKNMKKFIVSLFIMALASLSFAGNPIVLSDNLQPLQSSISSLDSTVSSLTNSVNTLEGNVGSISNAVNILTGEVDAIDYENWSFTLDNGSNVVKTICIIPPVEEEDDGEEEGE